MSEVGRTRLALFLCALVPFGLSIYATRSYGLELSPDSVSYLSAAESVNRGLGFLGTTGDPLTYWPPLFPVVLAALQRLGMPVLEAARFLNALAWSGAAVLVAAWIASLTRSLSLSVFGGLAAGLSPTLLWYATMLWSEALFIPLIIAALYALTRFLAAPTLMNLMIASIIAGAATQQRYAGAVAIVVGTVSIILLARGLGIYKRAAAGFLYGFIASLPTLAWLARNLFLSGTLTGERFPSAFGLREILVRAFSSIGIMFLPSRLSDYSAAAGIAVAITVVATPALVCYLHREKGGIVNSTISISLFVLTYTAFIIATTTLTNTCCVERFMGVIYPLFVIQGAFILYILLSASNGLLRNSILLACFVWLAIPADRSASHQESGMSHGVGDFRFLEEFSFPQNSLVFSNKVDLVWLKANIRYPQSTPAEGRYSSNIHLSTMPAFLSDVQRDPNQKKYIVWFDTTKGSFLHSLEDIKSKTVLDLVGQRDGVSIFEIKGIVSPAVDAITSSKS